MKTPTSYTAQAEHFATANKIKLSVIGDPEYKKHFPEDKQERYVFKLKLTANQKQYTFTFGQSISAGAKEPTMYDVLTCLTKYDPREFTDFCSEYGYNEDSRTAERTYKAVVKEFKAMQRLFSPEILEQMQEIQ